ncbi:hypothetical protein SAMN04487968_103161 [Nocardioides terrae]|uniref:Uncharacterized protein n=1 Tax=Nocardioides terrae TaxID=574651 RepID=A0A1I1FWY7_9ACTN|nr:hypothetical protein [Nocardioides terrae]SFC03825.1 hypothetical protein SAMN04487968_103161 [Nocardioides terrae]
MSRNIPGGFRRHRRIADSMTPELYACVERSLAAERAGDVAAALEWHQAVPMFRKGRNRWLLDQLVQLGDDLPDWVWARWIAYQTARCEDGDTGHVIREWHRRVIEELHQDLLEDCYRHEGDPIKVVARVLGESWAFHQAVTHEGGALTAFLDEFATGRLAEHTDLVRTWTEARMGGYELGDRLPGALLRVREAGGDWLEAVDLGALCCSPGGWVIGRLVPSGTGDRLMFDMPPLGVPSAVARAVAGSAEVDWLQILARARDAGRMASAALLREDYQLTTDVLDLELLRFGTPAREHGRVMQQLREGRDEVSPAAYRVLDRARRGEVDPADQAYVGAAVLNARAYQDARRDTVRSVETAAWAGWVDLVLEPARTRLLELAKLGLSAA